MRDRYHEFEAKNIALATIGMGGIDEAKDFRARHEIPWPLLVDPDKLSYRAFDVGRGSWLDVTGPRVWGSGIRALASRGVARPKQDALQLGSAVVVAPGGAIRFVHRARTSADIASVQDMLDAI